VFEIDHITVLWFVALVVAVILHEISHGVVALWFGDDTARRAGRLTLNPIPHIDPFGSIVLPALGALTGFPVIAWAKPVPVDPRKMRNGRHQMLLVALAGPITNFTLMVLAAVVTKVMIAGSVYATIDDLPIVAQFLFLFAVVNLFLGLFNLLPIPPLDGSAMLERVLPVRALETWYRIRPYGILVLFLLVFSTNWISRLFNPFLERLLDFISG
jgi:Zn-dependent protease